MIHFTVGFKAIIVIAIVAVASVSGVLLYEATANANSHPSLQPAQFCLTNLTVNPPETNINQPVSIKVNVENIGQEVGNYSADLWVNGTLSQNKEVTLDGGQSLAVDFTLSEPNPGVYSIWIGNLTSTFSVIAPPSATPAPTAQPTPKPTDRVAGGGGTIVGGGGNTGGSSGGTRSWTSCPSLFIWNGTGYSRASEISDGPGWLGFVDHYNADGSITFAYSNPWSFIKLNSSTLHPVNNFYDMTVTEQSDEIFYLDSIKLLAVDHSADVDVYSTRGTYLYDLTEQGTIYTIGHNLLLSTLALNNGVDVLQQVSTLDGNYTTANRWSWNTLELNLGDLSAANSIKLVVNAVTNWPTNEQGGNWATQFSNQPGTTPSPPPYMEVKAANGTWVKVADSRQFPIPPVDPSTFVVDLTGLFPTNDYSLRINYYQDYTFDYIGVDTTSQQKVSLYEFSPSSAILSQAFAINSNSTGRFTRYGDVSALVVSADDMYVVGRQGDSIQLKFQDTVPIPNGMVRDYFVAASAWFKGQGLPYVPFTVEPLPFQNMTSYLYPTTESYPNDSTHQTFLSEYNTRQFTVQSLALQSVDKYQNQDSVAILLISAVSLIIAVAIFVYRRNR